MPLPRWLARLNRRVFNPREIRKGVRPVLTHVGRVSGAEYRTPMDAHPVDGGYVFICNYGPESDWVRNVLASGSARLRAGGRDCDLTSPRMIDHDEAWALLPEGTKPMPGWMNVSYLRMDTAG